MIQWLTFVAKSSPAIPVKESGFGQIPDRMILEQNYPNPFNPTTAISYQLSEVSLVSLKIFDTLGRKMVTLVNGQQAAGRFTVRWDGKDDRGKTISSGIYLCQLRAGTNVSSRKMVLLK